MDKFEYDYTCPINLVPTDISGGLIIKAHNTENNNVCRPNNVFSGGGYKKFLVNKPCKCPNNCGVFIKEKDFEEIEPKQELEPINESNIFKKEMINITGILDNLQKQEHYEVGIENYPEAEKVKKIFDSIASKKVEFEKFEREKMEAKKRRNYIQADVCKTKQDEIIENIKNINRINILNIAEQHNNEAIEVKQTLKYFENIDAVITEKNNKIVIKMFTKDIYTKTEAQEILDKFDSKKLFKIFGNDDYGYMIKKNDGNTNVIYNLFRLLQKYQYLISEKEREQIIYYKRNFDDIKTPKSYLAKLDADFIPVNHHNDSDKKYHIFMDDGRAHTLIDIIADLIHWKF